MKVNTSSRAYPPNNRGQRLILLALLTLLAMAGCVHDPTIGPLFSESPTPPDDKARAYLYRIDPQHSYSMVELRLDQEKTIHLLDEEYLPLELSEGTHEIAFRLRRRFGVPASRWQSQRLRTRGGEKVYFEIAVQIMDRAGTSARESEIAGRRSSGITGEVVSMRKKEEREAIERLRMTHLHLP
ncbi:MAG: hypothetical protein AB8G23_12795 [Myxococcota bacterium]